MLQGSSTDGQVMYAPISKAELIECSKKGEYLCKFGLKFVDIRSTTCIAAIVNDDPDLIHDTCDFRFYRNQFRPGFVPVSNSELIFYNVDKVEIECGKSKRYSEVCCTFCLFHVPCNCNVTFGLESYSTSSEEGCTNVKPKVSRYHAINLAVLKAFQVDTCIRWDHCR